MTSVAAELVDQPRGHRQACDITSGSSASKGQGAPGGQHADSRTLQSPAGKREGRGRQNQSEDQPQCNY
jgi:hypothetical protein